MSTTPPDGNAESAPDAFSLWKCLHDGQIREFALDQALRFLRIELRLGFPDAHEVGESLVISFKEVSQVFTTAWIGSEGCYGILTTISPFEYGKQIGELVGNSGLIYDATAIVRESGVALQLSDVTVGSRSWEWELDGKRIEPLELEKLGSQQWKKWAVDNECVD